MNRILCILSLALTAGSAWAQDCSDDCKSCPACQRIAAAPTADAATTDLADARKDLKIARGVYRRLTSYEQEAIVVARYSVFEQSTRGKAFAPTLGAAADLMQVAAQMEKKDSGKESKASTLSADIAVSLRAMAKSIAGKKAHPVLDLADQSKLSAATAKARLDFQGAKTLWIDLGKGEDAQASDWRVIKNADPRHRALAKNLEAIQTAFATLDKERVTPKKTSAAGVIDGLLSSVSALTQQLTDEFDGVKTKVWDPPPPPVIGPAPQ